MEERRWNVQKYTHSSVRKSWKKSRISRTTRSRLLKFCDTENGQCECHWYTFVSGAALMECAKMWNSTLVVHTLHAMKTWMQQAKKASLKRNKAINWASKLKTSHHKISVMLCMACARCALMSVVFHSAAMLKLHFIDAVRVPWNKPEMRNSLKFGLFHRN